LVVLLLGLDTATPAVTVALHDGGQPLAQLVTVDAHRHAELLAPAIAKVVADAGAAQSDLTGIAVGVGPGPYTGLRVGLVTARVLGAALGIPVYGVCSLDIIAADVDAGGDDFLVATDARRRELYWARYDGTGRRTAGPEVAKPTLIPV
jgi:tRNA threonylcarbamoyladenosine biosynthesis protein TsaB